VGVLVDRDYDPRLPAAAYARHHIVQGVINIGRNALLAVGALGRLVMRTRVRNNVSIGAQRHRLVALVEVEDNGPGVPPEISKTLFLPLVTSRPTGTGLGLAVAQDLVTRHSGIIEYTSQPGRTIFSMVLPLEGNAS
jgi:two-component system nitrogen regulation sensor histidine kinase GlnL